MLRSDNKNTYIIITIIIIGTLFTTYFITDIIHKSEINNLNNIYSNEIKEIKGNNINFSNIFIESLILYDSSSKDRLLGSYHFDLAFFFYNETLKQNTKLNLDSYKNTSLDNCEKAQSLFYVSYLNYKSSKTLFNNSKKYAINNNFIKLIDLYIDLTESGSKLTLFQYNSSRYLKQIIENITFIDGLANQGNVTIILQLLYENMTNYYNELEIYEQLEDEIEMFDIFEFNPKREPS